MITITDTLKIQPDNDAFAPLLFLTNEDTNSICTDLSKFLFFDIETTGFSARSTVCYLIGCVYRNGQQWQYTQWFSELPEQEPEILQAFFEHLNHYTYLVHFNGEGFDIPYLKERCRLLGLQHDFNNVTSIDLFRYAKAASKLLDLENYKQKTIERFLGICRTDTMSGGDLIAVYQKYVADRLLNAHPDAALLLLHNHDDICALPALSGITAYAAMTRRSALLTNMAVQDKTDIIFTLTLPFAVPVPAACGQPPFCFTVSGNMLHLRVQMYTGELKYFYPNYKDYYYLPAEDCAIHKSVGTYVDKNFRTQAKAANCYSKKRGTFLPQTGLWESPSFKMDYHNALTYFEADDNFFADHTRQCTYAMNVIRTLCPC